MPIIKVFVKYRFSIIWAIIILVLSGLSGDTVAQISFLNIPHFDKIVHAGIYFILCSIIIYESEFFKSKYTAKALSLIALISIMYGIIMELMQEYVFIKRSNDLFDIIANSTGAAFSIFAFVIYKRIKARNLDLLQNQ
ncbi:MAG: hypothetical protein A2046_05880 [Bacteroidetes bacterium GWA2_30_7]|nr:MAG: hypothetical protein A2046_05880 [Bacteroidetes bacterium GWA2_30_7]